MSTYIMSSAMSSAMSNKFSNTETNSEGQTSTLLHGLDLTQLNNSSYADAMSSAMISRARSTLAPDAISRLTLTPDYLSTGAPRLVPVWRRCCQCTNLANPILAPEKCSICSHSECPSCTTENVPA
ncbi:hypothetical protein N7517_009680 [Penicillium concentricum]|uniref:Uncharacterized protein n=1 Tax=Penicillium concentricum TaxID=293559 RepID=A0A9W9UXP6_9EURO|nr:uncharacterized protein N7517_009680 [Penicillium concentricum]KAJ5360489.1 hypothetical protein N7517_009680 [Penicillium concentricum]